MIEIDRLKSLEGKEVKIKYYLGKDRHNFTEIIIPLIKVEGDKLYLGVTEPSDAIPLVVDINDIKEIEEYK